MAIVHFRLHSFGLHGSPGKKQGRFFENRHGYTLAQIGFPVSKYQPLFAPGYDRIAQFFAFSKVADLRGCHTFVNIYTPWQGFQMTLHMNLATQDNMKPGFGRKTGQKNFSMELPCLYLYWK
jgi:hypothetical protein